MSAKKPRKPSVWPPQIKGWGRGDGTWGPWDESHGQTPCNLTFYIDGSRFKVWGRGPVECMAKRDEARKAVADCGASPRLVATSDLTVAKPIGA